MKRIGLLLSVGLALCANTASVQAHGWHGGCSYGGGWCGNFLWPFWGFGLGLGLGAAVSSSSRDYYHSYPVYSYYPQSYAPPAPSAPADPPPPQTPVWVPSTPGAGHWVPEPTPYHFTAETKAPPAAAPKAAPQTVTITRTRNGVKVFSISS